MSSLTPHGPGFSFVDSITLDDSKNRLVAKKWLDPQLLFFADHFPGKPLMPGVLLIECAAQACGALWGSQQQQKQPQPYALAQVLQFRFIKPVFPSETLFIEVELEKDFGPLAQFLAVIKVEGNLVAEGKIVLSSSLPSL
jgi:3-hydroxyacyl-[acyl-carrier-protein] dehydratase